MCLLFFHIFIDTKILTNDEIDTFLELLQTKNKFVGNEWKLLYRKSDDGRYDDEQFVRQIYEDKHDILVIVEAESNNVLGGYSHSGWNSGHRICNTDDKAYVFGIRSSEGFEPSISNVKTINKATFSCDGYYFYFGWTGVIFVRNGKICHQVSNDYESFPTDRHLLAGAYSEDVKDMEIFQIQ